MSEKAKTALELLRDFLEARHAFMEADRAQAATLGSGHPSVLDLMPLLAAEDKAFEALIAVSPAVVQEEIEQRRQLAADVQNAGQALIYAVQKHPDGDIGRDWSSWRVGYSRGVYRGYGCTDTQQLISAVCQATDKPDPYQ